MNVDMLRRVCDAKPFTPFVIHIGDGRNIAVPSREFVFLSPSGRMAVVAEPDDSLHIIDLLLVTDLEIKPVKKKTKNP